MSDVDAGSGGALAHIRVLDLAGLSGGFAGKLLADLGADVVKVEPPGGDGVRFREPLVQKATATLSIPFLLENSNKRSIIIDLESETGRETFRLLATAVDVIVETAPPGWMGQRSVGYESLAALNAGLVYAAITPYGQTGPHARLKGSDITAQAMGGSLMLTGEPGGRPVRSAVRAADKAGSYVAATAIVTALYHRLQCGRGQFIDVSMQEAMLAQIEHSAMDYADSGQIVHRDGRRYQTTCPAGIYPASDGWVTIVAASSQHWITLRDWVQDRRLLRDEFLSAAARVAHRDFIDPIIAEWTRTLPRGVLFEEGQARAIPIAPSLRPSESVEDRHLRETGYFVRATNPSLGVFDMPGAPYVLSETPWQLRLPAPSPGQDQLSVESAGRNPEPESFPLVRDQCPAPLALTGVRVLDLTWGIAGAVCSRHLADLGAEVIKIESARSMDPLRTSFEAAGGGSLPLPKIGFVSLNRNKLGASLNLKHPAGRQLFLRLVRESDVVLNNFSAGTLRRLGLGYDTLRRTNPRIIDAEISAMGQAGPYSSFVAYGQIAMALAGGFELTSAEDNGPCMPTYTLPDFAGGTLTALAISASLIWRAGSGRGQHVDTSLFHVTATLMAEAYLTAILNGRDTSRQGNAEPGVLIHDCFRCEGEDQWCAIVVRDSEEYAILRAIVGETLPQALPSASLAKANRELEDWTRQRSADDVMKMLQAAGLEAARLQTGREIVEQDEHFAAREYLVPSLQTDGRTLLLDGIPFKMSHTPPRLRVGYPGFGEHNEYVFERVLGLSREDLANYRRCGAIE